MSGSVGKGVDKALAQWVDVLMKAPVVKGKKGKKGKEGKGGKKG